MVANSEGAMEAKVVEDAGLLSIPAWVDEEVAVLWQWAQTQTCGSPPLLEKVSVAFAKAEEAAREEMLKYLQMLQARGQTHVDEDNLRKGFAGNLGVRVRLAVASATDSMFEKLCLLPETCQNERSAEILTKEHLSELTTNRVVVIEWALKPKDVLAARREAETLDAEGKLIPHQGHNVGSGTTHRGDRITWIKGSGDGALANVVRLLQGLAVKLEGCDFGPLHVPPEAMLACYPGAGTHYKKHHDSIDTDPRRVTCILYLQTLAWKSDKDGGELRVFPPGRQQPKKVEPVGGRLVIFDSRVVEHEVLPARAMRMAITLWLRRRPPHSEGLQPE